MLSGLRTQDALVGLVALALVPWIGWTLRRGFMDARLPLGRAYLLRAERPGAFAALAALYAAAAALAAWIAFDLLTGARS